MAEAYSPLQNALKYYGRVENGTITKYGAQIPFNFQLMQKTAMESKSNDYIETINSWLLNLPKGNKIQANWVVRVVLAKPHPKKKIDFHANFLTSSWGITITNGLEQLINPQELIFSIFY